MVSSVTLTILSSSWCRQVDLRTDLGRRESWRSWRVRRSRCKEEVAVDTNKLRLGEAVNETKCRENFHNLPSLLLDISIIKWFVKVGCLESASCFRTVLGLKVKLVNHLENLWYYINWAVISILINEQWTDRAVTKSRKLYWREQNWRWARQQEMGRLLDLRT